MPIAITGARGNTTMRRHNNLALRNGLGEHRSVTERQLLSFVEHSRDDTMTKRDGTGAVAKDHPLLCRANHASLVAHHGTAQFCGDSGFIEAFSHAQLRSSLAAPDRSAAARDC